MSKVISQQAVSLLEALYLVNEAATTFEVISKEKDVHTNTKHLVSGYASKCNWIINDLKSRLSDSDRQVLEEAMSDEEVLQFANVKRMYFDLDKEGKNKVEQFIENYAKDNL